MDIADRYTEAVFKYKHINTGFQGSKGENKIVLPPSMLTDPFHY